jgi:hypothetical protein
MMVVQYIGYAVIHVKKKVSLIVGYNRVYTSVCLNF